MRRATVDPGLALGGGGKNSAPSFNQVDLRRAMGRTKSRWLTPSASASSPTNRYPPSGSRFITNEGSAHAVAGMPPPVIASRHVRTLHQTVHLARNPRPVTVPSWPVAALIWIDRCTHQGRPLRCVANACSNASEFESSAPQANCRKRKEN